MKLLITGGAGFIGSNFVHYVFSDQFFTNPEKVVVFDKLTYAGIKDNIKEYFNRPDFEFIEGDLADYEQISRAIINNGIDTIVHFAAETHVDRSIEGPRAFVNANIVGTFNILEVLRQHPEIRFHHVSTDEVFGELPIDQPEVKFNELTPYAPKSPYSASKAASDLLVRAYVSTYKIKSTISNCSNNYGPFCFPEKLIPLVITRALKTQEIPVYGDGKQVRDWIHVHDHCRGIGLCLEKGRLGETYMFGGSGEQENIWIVKEILTILNKPDSLIVHVGDRKGHDVRYAVDYSKAQRELGYVPAKPISVWLKETVEWYERNRSWWEPLKPQADEIAQKYLARRIE